MTHNTRGQSSGAPTDDGLAARDILLLPLRALLARAHGDAEVYNQLRDRYRDMAESLGFEGHIDWARRDAMTAVGRTFLSGLVSKQTTARDRRMP
jgi:hypothetical protein